MERSGFITTTLKPAGMVFAVLAVSFVGHSLAWRMDSAWLHDPLCHLFGLSLFISLGFGAWFVYGRARRNGASPAAAGAASLINPGLWAVKEVFVLTGIYSLAESLYFLLNPMNMLLFSAAAAEIGLAELLFRRKMKKSGRPAGSSLGPALLFLVGLASVVFMFAWDLGVHHFYIFQEGYKALFGFGV